MDAWARELVDTGYLHNHTRMWFASIWVFTLGLPWQLGADFFLRHLLDGDAASNTLSWRWVAGLQTRGKTYLATASNIARYTDGQFSPSGLATTARALDEEPFPPGIPVPPEDVVGTVGGRAGLLLHEEDLDAGSLLADPPVSSRRSARPRWQQPLTIVHRRVRRSWCVPSPTVRWRTPRTGRRTRRVEAAQVLAGADSATVLDWARTERLDTVVVPVAPVGPVWERLAVLRGVLDEGGVELVTVRRRWDSRAWPFASRGFFPFRERIPALVRER